MWSKADQLDWWVKERPSGGVAYAARTAVNGGSELLIFVRPAARRRDLTLSFVASNAKPPTLHLPIRPKPCRLFADVVVQCAGQPFEGGRGDAVRLRVAMRRFQHGGGVFGAGRVFRRR